MVRSQEMFGSRKHASASNAVSRRSFLQHTLTTAGAAPWIIPSRVLGGAGRVGANDRIRIGLIGVGVRGKYLIANLPEGGQIVALCDCSLGRIASAREPKNEFRKILAGFSEFEGRHCATYQDYRQMLDEARLDAVIIATPDHHHAQAAVLACQAGLDVYVEKPLAVTIREGRAIVDAAERHQRIVQVGSQQRTMEVNRFACEFVRDGGLGQVSIVQLRNFPGPMPIEDRPQLPIPEDLAWDLFCGPTPLRDYHPDFWIKDDYRFGYLTWRGWDLWRDYSGHLMTNWGGHSVDMVQYALGMDDTGPVTIEPDLKKLEKTIDDAWHEKTPPLGSIRDKEIDQNRFRPVSMRYANGTVIRFDPGVSGIVLHGERGRLFMSRNNYRVSPRDLAPPPDEALKQRWEGDGHVARPHLQNWLDCLRTRQKPNAWVEVGHRTATICHLANIARELGRTLNWDPQAEQFANDDEANALLQRPRRRGFELPGG